MALSQAFLTRLRTYPSLPTQSWYYITLVTLAVCNKTELIDPVIKHAFQHSAIPGSLEPSYVSEERTWLAKNPGKVGRVDEEGRESALRILRRCREGLVKTGVIGGIPKAINSLYHLRKTHSEHLLDPLPTSSLPSTLHPLSTTHPTARIQSLPPNHLSNAISSSSSSSSDPSTPPSTPTFPSSPLFANPTLPFLTRGSNFFNQTYGTHLAPKVLTNLQKSSPDLQVLATWVYALFLSETSILSAKETSFTLIAALVPQDVNAQLKPHLQGAINNGATKEEVESVRSLVVEVCKEVGVKWKGEVAKL